MPNKSITKVSSAHAPKGRFGQKYLASGIHISIPSFGNVSSQPKRSRRPRAIAGRSDWSLREKPSCVLKANSC